MGENPERLFRKSGMLNWHNGPRDDWIPFSEIARAASISAHKVGCSHFGSLLAGTTNIDEMGTIGKIITASGTVNMAIQNICRHISTLSTTSHFRLVEEPDNIWLHRSPITGTDSGHDHWEQYSLILLVKVIRFGLRIDWKPKAVRMHSRPNHKFQKLEMFRDTDIRWRCRNFAIKIPRTRLADPLSENPVAIQPGTTKGNQFIAPNFVNTFRQSVQMMICAHQTKIEYAARVANMEVRTLQRRLELEKTSYRKIVQEVRFNIAVDRLATTNKCIDQIAAELGYRQQAHFTRAFKYWTSMTPSQYRAAADAQMIET